MIDSYGQTTRVNLEKISRNDNLTKCIGDLSAIVKLPSWGRPCVPRHLAGSRMPSLVAPLQSDNREVHIYIHLHIHGERMRKWESTWKYSTKGMHIFQVSWVKIWQTQVLRSFESNIRDVLQDWRRERSDAKVANLETQIICGIIWNSKKKCTRTGEYTPIFWWETLTSYFKRQASNWTHSSPRRILDEATSSVSRKLLRMADVAENVAVRCPLRAGWCSGSCVPIFALWIVSRHLSLNILKCL